MLVAAETIPRSTPPRIAHRCDFPDCPREAVIELYDTKEDRVLFRACLFRNAENKVEHMVDVMRQTQDLGSRRLIRAIGES